jgi:hypothetical protein
VSGVGDQQDHARDSKISLLCADAPLHGLDVVDPCLRFHERLESFAVDDGVSAPPIALNRDWHFGSASDIRCETCSKALEQGEVGGIAYRLATGVKRRIQLESQDSRDLGHDLNRQLVSLASLHSTNQAVRDTDLASDLALAQSGGSACRQQLSRGPTNQVASAARPRSTGRS